MALDPNSILIVDDEPEVHAYLRRNLKAPDQLISVNSAEHAIAYLESHDAPFLAFLDLRLSGMTGFDLLAWMRNRPAYARTIIIVLSGALSEEGCHRSYELGAFACVDKFPDRDELIAIYDIAKTRAMRERHAALSAAAEQQVRDSRALLQKG